MLIQNSRGFWTRLFSSIFKIYLIFRPISMYSRHVYGSNIRKNLCTSDSFWYCVPSRGKKILEQFSGPFRPCYAAAEKRPEISNPVKNRFLGSNKRCSNIFLTLVLHGWSNEIGIFMVNTHFKVNCSSSSFFFYDRGRKSQLTNWICNLIRKDPRGIEFNLRFGCH